MRNKHFLACILSLAFISPSSAQGQRTEAALTPTALEAQDLADGWSLLGLRIAAYDYVAPFADHCLKFRLVSDDGVDSADSETQHPACLCATNAKQRLIVAMREDRGSLDVQLTHGDMHGSGGATIVRESLPDYSTSGGSFQSEEVSISTQPSEIWKKTYWSNADESGNRKGVGYRLLAHFDQNLPRERSAGACPGFTEF